MKSAFIFLAGAKPVFALAISLLIAVGASAAPAANEASDVTICEYSSKGTAVIGEIHAGRIFTDYQRFGFFRIGILPVLAVDDVQVKIQSAEYLTNGLDDLESWQPSSGLRHMEIRNLQILVSGEQQPRLRAAIARPGRNGTVNLATVTFSESTGAPLSLPQATLQISGPSAGLLAWNSAGHAEKYFVFPPQAVRTP
jgi:hypothetical protein